jgi:transcription initiation factor IIE alpha subunit
MTIENNKWRGVEIRIPKTQTSRIKGFLTKEFKDLLCEVYQKEEMTIQQLSEETGVNQGSINDVLTSAGLHERRRFFKRTNRKKQKVIIQQFNNSEMPSLQLELQKLIELKKYHSGELKKLNAIIERMREVGL